ncbi:hypothetical protein Q7P37_006396 [Cladosporium fusiforme]
MDTCSRGCPRARWAASEGLPSEVHAWQPQADAVPDAASPSLRGTDAKSWPPRICRISQTTARRRASRTTPVHRRQPSKIDPRRNRSRQLISGSRQYGTSQRLPTPGRVHKRRICDSTRQQNSATALLAPPGTCTGGLHQDTLANPPPLQVLAVDLLNPSPQHEARKHKLKTLVPGPRSFFMDVKCPGCFTITTVFSHAQTVVVCAGCSQVLCQPTGGKARLTEGCSFRRK